MRLEPDRTAILIVDFQERLAAAMPAGELATCQRNVLVLLELARQLGLPVVLSEQYPQGLGPTVAPIAEEAATVCALRLEKLHFSCAAAPGFAEIRARVGRPRWILCGMEAHVCVYQTARDLIALGDTVHLPADAVISRAPANARIGLELAARAGGFVTSTETVVFDVLGRAGTPAFKALSRLVR